MKLTRFAPNVVLSFVTILAALPAYADTDRTYTGGWRNSEDVVVGWDWSLPAGVKPTE